MLPYRNGDFTADELAAATVSADDADGRLLVKVPNGDYAVSFYPFAERGLEDELGTYGDVVCIAPVP